MIIDWCFYTDLKIKYGGKTWDLYRNTCNIGIRAALTNWEISKYPAQRLHKNRNIFQKRKYFMLLF